MPVPRNLEETVEVSAATCRGLECSIHRVACRGRNVGGGSDHSSGKKRRVMRLLMSFLCCRGTRCWVQGGIDSPWSCTFGLDVCLSVTGGGKMFAQTWRTCVLQGFSWFSVIVTVLWQRASMYHRLTVRNFQRSCAARSSNRQTI